MYEVVEVVQRIKGSARQKGIKTSDMLIACELSKNALSSMSSRGSWIQANSLAKIADYLNVSVDYLLGRTNEPQTIGGHSINTGDITGYNNANINDSKEKNCSEIDGTDLELLTAFSELSLCDKAKVMSLIAELSEK